MTELVCEYVLARYVANPLRDEARNIGVILRAPKAQFISAQFVDDLEKHLGPALDESDIEILKEYIGDLESRLSPFQAPTRSLFVDSDLFSGRYLGELWESFSGKFQFTRPRGAVASDPTQELKRLFDFFVLPEKESAGVTTPRETLLLHVIAELEKRNLRPQIGLRYPVKIKAQKIPFSFGYRPRRDSNREVVVETIDLSAESFVQRVRALGPANVKFEIAKSYRKRLEAFCVVQLPELTPSLNGEFELEIEALRRHADDVINFYNQQQREQFLGKIQADLS